MFPVIWVETLRSFGKRSALDTFLGIATLGFYIYYVNYTQKLEYIADRSLIPKNKTADTINSLLFAVIVATLVHTYLIQPYTIPTSSLEKSLLVGDFLLWVKWITEREYPWQLLLYQWFIFDTIDKIKIIFDLPSITLIWDYLGANIERTDIVVFNWPVDTVYKFFDTSKRRAYKPVDKIELC